MSEMKENIRYAEDKPKSCEFCYWWEPKINRCVLGEEKCYYRLPEKKNMKPKSPCEGCPYGRSTPCLGFCMKKVLGVL